MICDEDPLRRRPRESTARRKRQERCVWMARKMTEWPSKRGPITKIMPSDGCIGDTVRLAVGKWCDFHEFGWHMGNVGLYMAHWQRRRRPGRVTRFRRAPGAAAHDSAPLASVVRMSRSAAVDRAMAGVQGDGGFVHTLPCTDRGSGAPVIAMQRRRSCVARCGRAVAARPARPVAMLSGLTASAVK